MNLDERMALRREMLYEVIGHTMESKGMLVGSYRFKVARTDKRGHRFAVMVDLSTDFLSGANGSQVVLSEIGEALATNARERYGLEVSGVYWRVDHRMKGAAPGANPDAPGRDSPAATEELAAFAAAWRPGGNVELDHGEYASDPAPLIDGATDERPA